ncbi:hypothetical protein [Faecalicatena orotica]|uniref:hypothetical protein n=1 Tax=Faecalicatena orotica TaxID=1544 RepID=UPI0032176FC3
MWRQALEIAILFLLGGFTVHITSWIGSVLHSVPSVGGSQYAVFTFRYDQNKPMTTNMLINILMPNICLVFMYAFCYKNQILKNIDILILYVCFYYFYRVILICWILNRKELFCARYELLNCTIGIGIAVFLVKDFLRNTEQIFIPITELVNEFWLIIILLVYKFAVLVCDKIFKQKTVVSEEMLEQYIIHKFEFFYKKFRNEVYIKREDNGIWILLFSIMLFENYNRGKFVRKIEKLKMLVGRSATVGIMQIKSKCSLTDEESIVLAYNKLKNEIVDGNIRGGDEQEIHRCAFQYNPDEDYSQSVTFIYHYLYKYLKKSPKYNAEFFLEENSDSIYELVNSVSDSGDYMQNEYMTIDDLTMQSGLSKEKMWKKIKKKNMTIYLQAEEARKLLEKYTTPKG